MDNHWWFSDLVNSNHTRHYLQMIYSPVSLRFIDLLMYSLLISVLFFAFGAFVQQLKANRERNRVSGLRPVKDVSWNLFPSLFPNPLNMEPTPFMDHVYRKEATKDIFYPNSQQIYQNNTSGNLV